jgi:site-specific DNA-methyltransferase (adenine-specific)
VSENKLYYGDNLDVLRRYVPSESVDLVYLDPPFKSQQDYNVLFAEKDENVNVAHIRDLRGVLDREKAEIGVLITMEPSTRPMKKEAAEAGSYKSPFSGERFPRIQILTIEQLLKGDQIAYPRLLDVTYKKAPRVRDKEVINLELPLDDEPF